MFAAIYLAVVGTHPDMFASAPSGPDLEQQLAQTQRDVTRVVADLDPLKDSVGQIKTDVANLKIGPQQASDRDQQILEKVASLEATVTQPKVAQVRAASGRQAAVAHKTIPAAAAERARRT